jgi:hypothetical protein
LSRLIDRAVQILTCLPDLDVSLIHSLRRAAHLQMLTDALVDFGSVPPYPTKNSRVIYYSSTHLSEYRVKD